MQDRLAAELTIQKPAGDRADLAPWGFDRDLWLQGSRAALSSTVAHLRSTFNYGRTVALPKSAVIAGGVRAQFRKRSDLSQQGGCHGRRFVASNDVVPRRRSIWR
jgi:hypothetical protein